MKPDDNAAEWLKVFQAHEPCADFKIAKKRPLLLPRLSIDKPGKRAYYPLPFTNR